MKPQAALLLLADSQLLFQPDKLPQVAQHFRGRAVRAAYVGAANGHQPEFFQLACSALETLFGSPVACDFVWRADELPTSAPNLLILAGGSVSLGWQFLQQPVVRQALRDVLQNPQALVIGVSAGAIHLSRGCDPEQLQPAAQVFLDAYPHFIAAHEEHQQWPSRQVWQAVTMTGDFVGIPFGGGLWIEGEDVAVIGNAALRQAHPQ